MVDAQHVTEDLGCHVYGVVRPTVKSACDGLVGLDGEPTRLVVHGSVAAVVSDAHLDRPPGRRADLMAYSAVLDAVAKRGPVVPVQFGSILRDEQDVIEQLLSPEEAYFDAMLEELAGRAQFQLRATYQQGAVLAEVISGDPRIARLRELTRERPEQEVYGELIREGELVSSAIESKREVDAQILVDAIMPFAAAHQVRLGSGVDELAVITTLVDDTARDAFEDALEALAEAVHERIQLRLVGPLPPYDFVGDD